MLFEFKHNDQTVYSGDFKSQAYKVSKFIQDNPDGYEARKRQRELANKKPRKCSYCSEPGHTKRTCET